MVARPHRRWNSDLKVNECTHCARLQRVNDTCVPVGTSHYALFVDTFRKKSPAFANEVKVTKGIEALPNVN